MGSLMTCDIANQNEWKDQKINATSIEEKEEIFNDKIQMVDV